MNRHNSSCYIVVGSYLIREKKINVVFWNITMLASNRDINSDSVNGPLATIALNLLRSNRRVWLIATMKKDNLYDYLYDDA